MRALSLSPSFSSLPPSPLFLLLFRLERMELTTLPSLSLTSLPPSHPPSLLPSQSMYVLPPSLLSAALLRERMDLLEGLDRCVGEVVTEMLRVVEGGMTAGRGRGREGGREGRWERGVEGPGIC